MANALYTKGKEKILRGQINWETDSIKVALIKNDYLQSLATDEFYSDISAHVLGAPVALTGASVAGGFLDAADISFASIAAGSTSEGVVIYKDTGTPATSPLLAYIDVITGFPVLTNGNDVNVQWDNGTYKIFSL